MENGFLPMGFTELALTGTVLQSPPDHIVEHCAPDDENAMQEADCNWDSIGVIEIKKYLARKVPRKDHYQGSSNTAQLGTAPVHELSKKAGAHRALSV